jgi:hypothetical protein
MSCVDGKDRSGKCRAEEDCLVMVAGQNIGCPVPLPVQVQVLMIAGRRLRGAPLEYQVPSQ